MKTWLFILSGFLFSLPVLSQNKIIDSDVQFVLDSLDNRMAELSDYLKQNSTNRNARFFRTKRELDMTQFARQFNELVYDEDLDAATKLIQSKTKEAEKRHDKFAMDYYRGYRNKLVAIRRNKMRRYQELLDREKTFKKEFDRYIKPNDEYSINRTIRMVELAIRYAEDTRRRETLKYLLRYRNYAKAALFDHQSKYELKKLTNNLGKYENKIEPMLDDDSLSVIQEAGQLVDQCYVYAQLALSELDTNYFSMQKIVAANAIADWNTRQGISSELSSLTEEAVVARFDSLNKEGIFQWNDFIIVIGTVSFVSKSEIIRRGEAIIAADKTLLNYVRVNKIAKVNSKSAKTGSTFILPYNEDGRKRYFIYDINKGKYQYMVCYRSVINEKVTLAMSQFLSPLQFQEEVAAQKTHTIKNDSIPEKP